MSKFFVHPSAILDDGCQIGENTKIWHFSHICSAAQIGANCNLGQNVFIADRVIIGNGVKIQNNVSVYEGVICEDDVFIGPSVVFTNILNPRAFLNRKNQFQTTLLKKGTSIGANATIVCGVSIGEYTLIGAGSVVTKSIKAYSLVVGNPSKQIGWVSQYGHRLFFDENGWAICKESGQKYILEDDEVKIYS